MKKILEILRSLIEAIQASKEYKASKLK